MQERDPDVLRHLIVKEDRVLKPHVEVPKDFLFDLPDVCGSLDQLSGQALLCTKFLILSRLQQVWIILVVKELLKREQKSCHLELGLVDEVLIASLLLRHALRVLDQTFDLLCEKLTVFVVLSHRVEML